LGLFSFSGAGNALSDQRQKLAGGAIVGTTANHNPSISLAHLARACGKKGCCRRRGRLVFHVRQALGSLEGKCVRPRTGNGYIRGQELGPGSLFPFPMARLRVPRFTAGPSSVRFFLEGEKAGQGQVPRLSEAVGSGGQRGFLFGRAWRRPWAGPGKTRLLWGRNKTGRFSWGNKSRAAELLARGSTQPRLGGDLRYCAPPAHWMIHRDHSFVRTTLPSTPSLPPKSGKRTVEDQTRPTPGLPGRRRSGAGATPQRGATDVGGRGQFALPRKKGVPPPRWHWPVRRG